MPKVRIPRSVMSEEMVGVLFTNIYNLRSSSGKKRCYGCRDTSKKLTIHHIIPKEWGGLDKEDNYVELCRDCHDALHNRLPDIKSHFDERWFIERLMKLKIFHGLAKEFPIYDVKLK